MLKQLSTGIRGCILSPEAFSLWFTGTHWHLESKWYKTLQDICNKKHLLRNSFLQAYKHKCRFSLSLSPPLFSLSSLSYCPQLTVSGRTERRGGWHCEQRSRGSWRKGRKAALCANRRGVQDSFSAPAHRLIVALIQHHHSASSSICERVTDLWQTGVNLSELLSVWLCFKSDNICDMW